jgi:hypothetical protein
MTSPLLTMRTERFVLSIRARGRLAESAAAWRALRRRNCLRRPGGLLVEPIDQRTADRDPVLLAGLDEAVDDVGAFVDEGAAEEGEHRLA